jgi:hypothetical protein
MMRRSYLRALISVLLNLMAGFAPLDAAWIPDGNPICVAIGDQQGPSLISDGRGGAIVVWNDNRNGTWDIYAQRIDAYGALQWATDGVAVCTAPNDQGSQVLVSDGAGGAIIAWRDLRGDSDGDIYAQRIGGDGIALWTMDGVAICTRPNYQANLSIIADAAHGAFITWFDYDETAIPEFRYFTQRVDCGGTARWQPDGALVYDVAWPYQIDPVTASDGAGGLFLSWWQGSGPMWEYVVFAQHADSSGTMLWSDKIMSFGGGTQWIPAMASDGAGGAIVVWLGSEPSTNGVNVVTQRFDHEGDILWGQYGVRMGSTQGVFGDREIISDDVGGAFVMWHDATTEYHSAQRVGPDGRTLWIPGGIDIGDRPAQTVCADGTGGMYLSWGDTSMAAERISASGECAWERVICSASGTRTNPRAINNGEGGALIAWQDRRNGDFDIYATGVDSEGETPVAVLLQSHRAYIESNHIIIIEWILSEVNGDERFFVLRSQDGESTYRELAAPGIQRNGFSFVCEDADCRQGVRYVYRVDISNGHGRSVLFESDPILLPTPRFALFQNHPNPFNPSTAISYTLPEETMVTLEIYDIAGRRISGLVGEEQPAGLHEARWDGKDMRGNPASSGIYLCRLSAAKQTITRKMILLK